MQDAADAGYGETFCDVDEVDVVSIVESHTGEDNRAIEYNEMISLRSSFSKGLSSSFALFPDRREERKLPTEDLHETSAEHSIEGNLVRSSNLQLGNKLDRKPDINDISDDVEYRYRRIRRSMIATSSLYTRIPRHPNRLADEESY